MVSKAGLLIQRQCESVLTGFIILLAGVQHKNRFDCKGRAPHDMQSQSVRRHDDSPAALRTNSDTNKSNGEVYRNSTRSSLPVEPAASRLP